MLSLTTGRVAEIGGGYSRTLPFFHEKGRQCWNIEPFEGIGNGPRVAKLMDGIESFSIFLGEFSPQLKDDYLEAVYSISVIEHVADNKIPAFFQDMFRITRKGGQSWHAIDVYLGDFKNSTTQKRILLVYESALEAGFTPITPESVPLTKFCCSYASNPDHSIRQWNESVPALKELRSCSQSVSLLLGMEKRE